MGESILQEHMEVAFENKRYLTNTNMRLELRDAENRKKYEEELKRLESFLSWPPGCAVEPTRLARAGFYYKGQNDIVCCFNCRTEIGRWNRGDLPMHKHRDYSPNCPFVKGECQENVPFETDSLPFSVDRIFSLEKTNRSIVNGESNNQEYENHNEIKSILHEKYKALSTKYPSVDSRQYIMKARDKSLQMYDSLLAQGAEGALNSSSVEGGAEGSLHAGGGSLNREISGNTERTRSQLTLGNTNSTTESIAQSNERQQPATIKTTLNHHENQGLTDYCRAEDLAPILPECQHPDYSDVQVRYRSFSNWTHHQNPKNLAQAGLFYTGEEDRVRCFMCGGGLSNWEEGDVPLYEHYRWFGNCPYVRECKKNAVVAAVLETAENIHGPVLSQHHHHHHEHTGRTQCDIQSLGNEESKTESSTAKTSMSLPCNTPKSEEPKSPEKHEEEQSTKPKDLQSLRLENEHLKSSRTCKVCLSNTVEVIFLPCSHLVCCLECSLQLEECPICRAGIRATAKVHV